MQANWQCPYPTAGFSLGSLADGESARKPMSSARKSRRDRFDYWLIFAVSLLVFACLGLVERCNPAFWLSRRDGEAASLWAQAKRGAHHLATMAFQG
jgi:hypothetical protein